MPKAAARVSKGPDLEQMNVLLARAQQGDRSVVPALRQTLDSRPELWSQLGDLTFQSQVALVEAVAGKNELAHEATFRKIAELRGELLGKAPTPLERLLVDRIIVGWLHVYHVDAVYVANRGAMTFAQSDCLRRRLESEHMPMPPIEPAPPVLWWTTLALSRPRNTCLLEGGVRGYLGHSTAR